jgi:hypothetical protein
MKITCECLIDCKTGKPLELTFPVDFSEKDLNILRTNAWESGARFKLGLQSSLPVCVVDEETKPNPTVINRFSTIEEATQWIEDQIRINPDKVHRGGYGIDAPEEMIN